MPRVPETITEMRHVVESNDEPHMFQKTERNRQKETPGELET